MKATSPISKGLIIENTPYNGEWRIKCECAAALTFSYRDRGTARNTLIVTHGDGEARLEIPGRSDESLLWALGLANPLGEWLAKVHEYEEREEVADGARET